jgi:hypothetical protein
MGSGYQTVSELDNGAIVVGLIPKRIEGDQYRWHVDVIYSTDWERTDEPLHDPPQIDFTSESFQQDCIGEANQDYNPLDTTASPFKDKNTMTTSAGEFIEGITRDSSRRIIIVTRNEATFSDKDVAFLQDTVNNGTWNNYPTGTVLCRSITAVGQLHRNAIGKPDYRYFQVKYEFVVKWDTWLSRPLDRGSYYIMNKGSNTERKVPFKHQDDTPYVGLLDGTGRRLYEETDTVDTINGKTPTYLKKTIYRSIDFSVFAIALGLSLDNQKLRRA